MAKKKRREPIAFRYHDQEKSHRLHRTEQSQYPDEGAKADREEAGQQGGERNPRDVKGNEGGG